MSSLILGGLEVYGQSAPNNPNPEYRLGTTPDYGELLPDTATLSSLLVDGDVITGDRTGNRTWNLTIQVTSPILQTRADLQAKVDTLCAALYTDGFSVIWTPTGCPSGVTAARGHATITATVSPRQNDSLWVTVTVSFQTPPFLQSAGAQSISIPASGAATQHQIDGMNSGSFTNATLSTSTKYEGAGSAAVSVSSISGTIFSNGTRFVSYATTANAGRTITSVDLSSYQSVSLRIRFDQAPGNYNVTVAIALASSGGSSFASVTVPMVAGNTGWGLATISIADLVKIGGTGVNLTAVTSWAVGITTNSVLFTSTQTTPLTLFIDDLRAYPPGSISNSDAQGGVLNIPAIVGSARTPVALEIDRAGSTFTNALIHSPPVSQDPDVSIHIGCSIGSPATIPAANMNYDDSFSVWGTVTASGSGTRTVTVTVTQFIGATQIGQQAWTTTVTGSVTLVDLTPPNAPLTLPLVAVPPENTNGSMTIAITSSGGSADTWTNIDLCSTSGQLVIVRGLNSPIACQALYIDMPDPAVGIGPMYAAGSIARTSAFSQMNLGIPSGGPILFEPGNGGNNKLLIASSSGALGVTIGYIPSWLHEALV